MDTTFTLPKISSNADPAVETRPVYVEETVESLAYANPPVLLQQSLDSLRALNTQPMKPMLRVTLLDLFLKPYAYGLNVRRTQRVAVSTASINRQRALSRQLRLTSLELALGYKQALSELRVRKGRFGGNKDHRICLQRPLLCASQVVLHCYDEYRPTEPGLWLEIFALYKAAQAAGVSEQTVSAAVEDAIFSQSIDMCFKRFCLTSLVDPYHLAYGELWVVHETFGEYAHALATLPLANAKDQAGFFVIDPALDRKPMSLVQRQSAPEPHCLLLNANPVLTQLRQRHQQSRRQDKLANHVLTAMIRALGLPPRRHTPREPSDGKVNVAPGLTTVYYFLGGDGVNTQSQLTDSPSPDDNSIEINDVDNLLAGQGVSYRHEPWRIVNEGPGGVGIVRDGAPQNPLGVGELVGVQFPLRGDDERDWSIGVVRWLSIGEHEYYRAGIQILSAIATPVTAFSVNVTETITRIPRPTLAVPELGREHGSTLLTPRGLFARGDMLRVESGNQTWLVEALALNESTAAYDRFTYRVIEGA